MIARLVVLASFVVVGPAVAASGPVLLPSPDNPLVAIRLFFSVGAADDPAGKEGLAALTANMLGDGGTRDRTYAQILDALYPLAAQIHTQGDKDSFVFTGTVHRDNLRAFADLLSAQILTPRFAADDFARNRQNAIDHLTSTLRGNDDENLGKEALAGLLYRGHPYGHPTAGTVAGLRAITLDDVRAFYRQHFTRGRLIVGIAGGYPADFAPAFVARFDALSAGGAPRRALPPGPARAGTDIVIVDKDARASAISIGHPVSVTRADADFYPLLVAASYLGEHRTFNGVLMKHMRQQRGLNYGDYAYVENFIQDGWSTFPLPNLTRRQQHASLWLRPVPPANALFALREAVYELDKLIRQGIPDDAFAATRTFLVNYAGLWTQDASRRLGYAIDAVVYGKDVLAELRTRLPTMTKADVDRAIRKHLSTKNLAIAIVSDKAESLRQTLLSGKATPITYDTKDTPDDVMAEDRQIENFPLGVTGGRVVVTPVSAMFER